MTILFNKNSIFNMDIFIEKNSNNIGYGFNLIQDETINFLKKLRKVIFLLIMDFMTLNRVLFVKRLAHKVNKCKKRSKHYVAEYSGLYIQC